IGRAGGAHTFVAIDDRGFSNIHAGSEFKQGSGVVLVLFSPGQRLSINFRSHTGANLSQQGVEVGHFHVRPLLS
ncbi:hypothetical protein ECNE1487_1168, partial [Escherichia coli NE1487]